MQFGGVAGAYPTHLATMWNCCYCCSRKQCNVRHKRRTRQGEPSCGCIFTPARCVVRKLEPFLPKTHQTSDQQPHHSGCAQAQRPSFYPAPFPHRSSFCLWLPQRRILQPQQKTHGHPSKMESCSHQQRPVGKRQVGVQAREPEGLVVELVVGGGYLVGGWGSHFGRERDSPRGCAGRLCRK